MTGAVPAGWKLVPIEPTDAMLDRFVSRALCVSVHGDGGWSEYARQQWDTMLAAVPATPSPQPLAEVERVLRLADKIDAQATCLEGYAEQDGHSGKAPASTYHWQATHFRDIAAEIRAALSALGGRA